MRHLGMKLYAVQPARLIRHGGDGANAGVGDGTKTLRRLRDLICVAHPALTFRLESVKKPTLGVVHGNGRAAILALGAFFNGRAVKMRHQLHTITNAQHRHFQLKDRLLHNGGVLIQHARRSAGEDNAHRLRLPDFLHRRAVRQH